MRRESRITSGEDYQKLYRNGKSVANRDLVIFFLKRKDEGLRIGISVSKRIGSAVVRNRTKRLIREAFRQNKDAIKKGYDIVFVARQPIREKSFHDVEKTFIDVLSKAGLIEKDEEDSHSID